MMAVAVLIVAMVAALLLVPLGLPGLWVMAGIALLYNAFLGTAAIGWSAIIAAVVLALGAEVIEFMLGMSYTRRYGGSRRAAWGAVFGGIAGAVVGVPVPIVGPMVGAFAGAYAGALAGELSRRESGATATRAAWGALLGRLTAVAVKMGLGCVVATWLVWDAWR